MRRMHSQHTSRAYNGQFTKHQHHVRTKSCTGAHVKNNTSHTFTLASFSWLGQEGVGPKRTAAQGEHFIRSTSSILRDSRPG
jgi:hypothetical protein